MYEGIYNKQIIMHEHITEESLDKPVEGYDDDGKKIERLKCI